jgi:hypothetical protein
MGFVFRRSGRSVSESERLVNVAVTSSFSVLSSSIRTWDGGIIMVFEPRVQVLSYVRQISTIPTNLLSLRHAYLLPPAALLGPLSPLSRCTFVLRN